MAAVRLRTAPRPPPWPGPHGKVQARVGDSRSWRPPPGRGRGPGGLHHRRLAASSWRCELPAAPLRSGRRKLLAGPPQSPSRALSGRPVVPLLRDHQVDGFELLSAFYLRHQFEFAALRSPTCPAPRSSCITGTSSRELGPPVALKVLGVPCRAPLQASGPQRLRAALGSAPGSLRR